MTQTNQTYIEEKKKSVEELKPLMPEAFNGEMSLEVAFKEGYNTAITQALQDAIKYGRDLELRILDRHIQEQIYERTITTDSLLKYIDEAREAIAKLTTSPDKKYDNLD